MLSNARQNWFTNVPVDLNQIPAGLEQFVAGESGFASEALVLGGKTICCSDDSLVLPPVASI